MRSWGKKCALVLMSTLFTLLIGEVVLRFLPLDFDSQAGLERGDALLGIPPAYAIADDFPQEAKPAGVYRIAVLGDSHTVQIGRENSFAEVLERLLNSDLPQGVRVEVLNAGGAGHSFYQYYLSLDRRLKQYRPDLVVVAPFIGNDFLDLYRRDDRPQLCAVDGGFEHHDPVFYKYTEPGGSANWLVSSSRLLQFVLPIYRQTIGYRLDRLEVMYGVGSTAGKGVLAAVSFVKAIVSGSFVDQHVFRQSMNQILFLKRFPEERAVIDKVNRHVTELMKKTADDNGIRLLYVPIPTRIQVEPEAIATSLDEILKICGLERSDLEIEDELCTSYVSMLDGYGIEHVSVEAALRERVHDETLFDFTYHIIDPAHRIIAQRLCEVIKPKVLSSFGR